MEPDRQRGAARADRLACGTATRRGRALPCAEPTFRGEGLQEGLSLDELGPSTTGWTSSVIAPDVNVLLYAFREDSERHAEYHAWLQDALNVTEPVALFEPALSAALRIAMHPARTRGYRVPRIQWTPCFRPCERLRTAQGWRHRCGCTGECDWRTFRYRRRSRPSRGRATCICLLLAELDPHRWDWTWASAPRRTLPVR